MDVRIEPSWKDKLKDEFSSPYFQDLVSFVRTEYQHHGVYPPGPQIFNAFNRCTYDAVRVVILGQDPYHGAGQANGLCFSVREDVSKPPSLRNIFLELKNDLGKEPPADGNLERWADQGVLLLNATLTVRAKEAGSHQNKGWEIFTDSVIRLLSENRENLVFLLWGAYAQRKGSFIDDHKHLVLKAAHPSPFAAHKGFFGCRHFSKTNEFLKAHGQKEVIW